MSYPHHIIGLLGLILISSLACREKRNPESPMTHMEESADSLSVFPDPGSEPTGENRRHIQEAVARIPISFPTSAETFSVSSEANRWILKLIGKKIETTRSGVLSPLGIMQLMGVIGLGASGTTLAELNTAIGVDFSNMQSHVSLGLLSRTEGMEHHRELEDGADNSLAMKTAIWIDNEYPVQPSFSDKARAYYMANIRPANFRTDLNAVRKSFSDWITGVSTDSLSVEIPLVVSSQSRLIIANAAAFSAAWVTPFQSDSIQREDFCFSSAKCISVSTMKSNSKLRYSELPHMRAVELNYKTIGTGTYSMIVVVSEDGFDLPMKILDGHTFEQLVLGLKPAKVDLWLPKWSTSSLYSMRETMNELGLKGLFDADSANFENAVTNNNLWVDAITHASKIRVDERGTEVVSATVAAMVGRKNVEPPPVTFRTNRPFIYFIVEKGTGFIAFAGWVADDRVFDAPVQ